MALAPQPATEPNTIVLPEPAAEPEPTPTDAADAPEGTSDDIFADDNIESLLNDDIDLDEDEPLEEPEPASEPEPEPIATPEPTPAPVVDPQPAPAPAVDPAAVEPTATPTPEATPEPQRPYNEVREEAITDIASRYTLTEEDAAALRLEPETVLPRMAAQIAVDVYEQTIAAMNQAFAGLPQVIGAVNQQQQAITAAEQQFFDRWPALNNPEYAQTIGEILGMYRQQNPSAPVEEAIEQVGAFASFRLGVPVEGQALVSAPASEPAPAARPHTPIAPSAASAATARQPQTPNIWETVLAEDDSEDD